MSNKLLSLYPQKSKTNRMKKIDVKKVIKDKGLDTREVAELLFPDNKHPRIALNRVLSGEAVLDANQISRLALFASVTVGELYGTVWESPSRPDARIVQFTTEGYTAELNRDTWVTKIFAKGTLFHEEVIQSGATAVSEYFSALEEIITKYESK